jgi:hypothetical protein
MQRWLIIVIIIGAGLSPVAVWKFTAAGSKEARVDNRLAESVASAVAATPDHADPCAVLGIARSMGRNLASDPDDIESVADLRAQEARAGRNCAPQEEPLFQEAPKDAPDIE